MKILTPFPHYPYPDTGRVSVTSLTPGSSPSNRSRTILGRVWTGTMDYHPKIPTARRRARSLGLGSASREPRRRRPDGTVCQFVMTGSHARARRPWKPRRTGQRDLSLLPLMSAAQYPSSKSRVRTLSWRGPRDGTALFGRRGFEENRSIEPGESRFDFQKVPSS